MKIEVNLEKKYFISLIIIGLFMIGFVGVYAYNASGTGGNPAVFGHSVDEMSWNKAINANVTINATLNVSRICIGNDCKTAWPSGGTTGVAQIIAGNGITINPAGGTGVVTINAIGGGGNLEMMFKRSTTQATSQEICCDSGWVRTGCGEWGDEHAYSEPTNSNCCTGGGWDDAGGVSIICARGDGGGDSGIDTRCDTTGTCSQVCIGSNCKNSWPSAGLSSCSLQCTTTTCTGSTSCSSGYTMTGLYSNDCDGWGSKQYRCCKVTCS